MPKFDKHIFICVNQRPASDPRGSCDPSGKAELPKAFKVSLVKHGVKALVRANKCGCLDQCSQGPTVVVYPEAVWYGRVTPDDVDEIVESHIIGDKPVERLMIPDEKLNAND